MKFLGTSGNRAEIVPNKKGLTELTSLLDTERLSSMSQLPVDKRIGVTYKNNSYRSKIILKKCNNVVVCGVTEKINIFITVMQQ